MRRALGVLTIGACLLVSGCKLDLYTKLSERDANEMLSVLMMNGIDVQKKYAGDDGVNLLVEQGDLARAIEILKDNGFPREEKESLGKVFQKSGIMSSPFEERVRYIYALEEGVSKTLSEIDGVLSARVHIVIPDESNYGKTVKPSSAAVFIKHRRGVDLDFFTPQIRRLVSNAIEGVDYENVTVVSVEAEPPQVVADPMRAAFVELFPGLGVRAGDERAFYTAAIICGLIVALLGLTNVVTLWAFLKRRRFRNGLRAGDDLQADPGE